MRQHEDCIEINELVSLSKSFGDSLSEDVVGFVGELAEVGLDSIMKENILKEIPLLSSVMSTYRIGNSLRDRHNIKKMGIFLKEIQDGTIGDKKRSDYKEKFLTNEKRRNQELEYLLILIDRHVEYVKPRMLARVYLSYLDEEISWGELTVYSEIIDRFLPGDYSVLKSMPDTITIHEGEENEAIFRLIGLGLMAESSVRLFDQRVERHFTLSSKALASSTRGDRIYRTTGLGKKLVGILSKDILK